jgi:peptidoglycan/LPS O-acetylase OafA/YrhL
MATAPRRFDELDSLRGLAAMAVFFSHSASFLGVEGPVFVSGITFRGHPLMFLLIHSPFHALWAGRGSVILFFILSGFVLSLPWLRGESMSYRKFAFKRICRIWIPYIVSCAVALSLRAAFSGKRPPGFFSGFSNSHLTASVLANIASLVGYFDPSAFNMATWSLVHEMRISLVFPLIMLVILGRSWKPVLAGAFGLSMAAGAARKLTQPDLPTDGWDTLHYMAFFLVGYLLAANMSRFRMTPRSAALSFAAGIGVYTSSFWFFPRVSALHPLHIDDWTMVAGAALLIVSALSSGNFARVLRHASSVWLGRISYSLYLYHVLVIFSLAYALDGLVRPIWIIVLALPITLLVAEASYRWVELPSIGLARTRPVSRSA